MIRSYEITILVGGENLKKEDVDINIIRLLYCDPDRIKTDYEELAFDILGWEEVNNETKVS